MDKDRVIDWLSCLTDEEFANLTAARTSRRAVPPGLAGDDVKALILAELNRQPEPGDQ